ncbi:disulfide bond formation protein DsbA [Sphingomonas spermidinifaciens]|uniref:Disulfide bond formation protein DsbA n=2 Tax=Sphingomonas spermidinifaciens TaxID=1141889 RepID=A0A2A4B7F3_9SPHN|nr:disulfide bond formation protein DsbA [Sphingomonas spermidinifaciens]
MLGRPVVLVLAFLLAGLAGAAVYALVRPAAPGGVSADAVRAALLERPEMIPEAMQALRDRETGKTVAANRAGIVTPFGDAWKGSANPDVTVVAYMDYACGYCRQSLPMLDRLIASDPKVRVVFRELPVLSAESRVAAEWSLAAAEQGKFRPFHDTLFAGGQLSQGAVDAAIARAGLDRARGAAFVKTPAAEQEISRNLQTAGQLGMTGTPSWVVGDRVLSGAVTLEAMQDAVKAARAQRV